MCIRDRADAAHQRPGRGDAFRQVGVGDGNSLQRRPFEGDEPQKHLAVAAHKGALDVVPALTIAGKHPFHHLLPVSYTHLDVYKRQAVCPPNVRYS